MRAGGPGARLFRAFYAAKRGAVGRRGMRTGANGVVYVEAVPSLTPGSLLLMAVVLGFAGWIAVRANAPPN